LSGRKRSGSRLGKGLNALIPGEVSDELEGGEVISDKVISDKMKSETVISEAVKTDHVKTEPVARETCEEDVLGEKVVSDMKSGAVVSDARSMVANFPEEVVERAVSEGEKNPRVVVWSPKASVAMRILKKTIPEFSISKVTSEILEEGIRERYPEVWEIVEQRVRVEGKRKG